MDLRHAMPNEIHEQVTNTIKSALKKHCSGAVAELMLYAIRDRVHRDDAGELVIDLLEAYEPERYTVTQRDGKGQPTMQHPNHGWSNGMPRAYPLEKALKLLLADDGPEVTLSRRQHVMLDEERQKAVKSAIDDAARRVQEAQTRRDHDRVTRWRSLSRSDRAMARLDPNAPLTAGLFQQAFKNEPEEGSQPPADWQA